MSDPSSRCRPGSRRGILAGRASETIDEDIPMRRYLDSIVVILQERTAEELIVGVFLALLLGVVGAGVHNLARRKVKDTVLLLTVVCLIANLIAVVAPPGYGRRRGRGGNFSNPDPLVSRPARSRGPARHLQLEA